MKTNIKNEIFVLWALTKRHLKIFLKNKVNVLFTLLVPVIILAVYALFLRPMELSQIEVAIDKELLSALKENNDIKKVYGIVDAWMISGVLATSCITVSLNTCYIQVRDKETGVSKDFISSPITSRSIMLSYFLFNLIVTCLVNIIVFIGCVCYLLTYGAFLMRGSDFFALIGIIILSSICSALIMFFICSLISSESILSSITAIASAAIGFLIGAYLPTSMLPKSISFVTMFFPGTYSAGLFRNYFMKYPVYQLSELVKTSYAQFEQANTIISDLQSNFSFNLDFFGNVVSPAFMVLTLCVYSIIFMSLNIMFSSRILLGLPKKKKNLNLKENTQIKSIENKMDIPSSIQTNTKVESRKNTPGKNINNFEEQNDKNQNSK